MDVKSVFSEIEKLEKKYIDFLVNICNIESPTDFKEGVDAVGKFCAEHAEALGFSVEYHREKISGDALAITMNEDVDAPAVVFSAHMDTVHPVGSFGTPPTKIDGDVIKGPGALDCKGGIAVAFLAMEALKNSGYKSRPIKLILQSDEEISSITSEKRTIEFMAKSAEGCVAFINGEGRINKDRITVERKGIIRYDFEVRGVARHSSVCYDGVSAIAEAAHKIIELERWKDQNGITCCCGIISGGTKANTVADVCRFTADIRYKTKAELAEVKRRVTEIAEKSYLEGSSCILTVKSERGAMELSERNLALANKALEIFESIGLPAEGTQSANGGSDAANISEYGIPTIDSLGAKGGYLHSPLEYAYCASIAESAKRYAAIALKI